MGGSGLLRQELRHIFPDDWSFFLGEIALYCFVILVDHRRLHVPVLPGLGGADRLPGHYRRCTGSEHVRGLRLGPAPELRRARRPVVRQVHHWAALVFAAALVFHLFRMFFTGAYRRPRRLNWVIGAQPAAAWSFINGVFGYSLPDDLLSGTGLRIAYSITQSMPLIGPNLASLLFGGDFPTTV